MSNEFFPAREDLGSRGRSEIYAFNFPQFIPALPFLLGLLIYTTIRKLSLLFETLILMGWESVWPTRPCVMTTPRRNQKEKKGLTQHNTIRAGIMGG